jgi:hypothetical protein
MSSLIVVRLNLSSITANFANIAFAIKMIATPTPSHG